MTRDALSTMRLEAEGCAAVFHPEDGGRLASFRVGPHELLVPHGKDIYHWGSFVMAPWVGRLRDARLRHRGHDAAFEPNSGPHALHGLVTDGPWTVTGEGELSVEIGEPWPWPCRVVQRTELQAGRATFRIELHASAPMPAAVGWHPWFRRRLEGSSSELELDVEPGLMWANDATGLPSGDLSPPVPRPWDYCFRDLRRDPRVRWPGALDLTIGSDCRDWVIYDMEEDGVCVEPWTAPPNSLNMPDPRIVVPGEPLVATMTWRWGNG